MLDLPLWAWGAILLIIAAAVLGVLYTLSSLLRDFHRSLALKMEVERLHREHAARLDAIRQQQQLEAEVEVV